MNIQPININNQVQFKSLELRKTINICTHKDLLKKKVKYMYKDSLLGRFIDWIKYTIYTKITNQDKIVIGKAKNLEQFSNITIFFTIIFNLKFCLENAFCTF